MAAWTPEEREAKLERLWAIRAANPDATHQWYAEHIGASRAWVTKTITAAEAELDRVATVETRALEPSTSGLVKVAKRQTGRKTDIGPGYGSTALVAVLPPPTEFHRWSEFGLDMQKWDTIPTNQLVKLLRQISPDWSRAIWDYLRLSNAGHTIDVFRRGTEDPYPEAEEKLQEFRDTLSAYYGTEKVVYGRMLMNKVMRGAILTELVLNDAGTEPIDLVVPDPATVRFRRTQHPTRGWYWEIGQMQEGKFVSLESPLIRYVATDPDSDMPYGTSMVTSALFPTIFLIGLMHDLRRVVAQQGYPRTDIKVIMEQLKAGFNYTNDAALKKLAQDTIEEITGYYRTLEPDDAFAHTDAIEVTTNGGAIATQVLAATAPLLDLLERQAMRGLKAMPLTMGMTDQAGESTSNRQWEIYAQGLKSGQQDAETSLEDHYEQALLCQGYQVTVRFRFAELRAAEEARDEQTFKLRLENAIVARDQGFWDQDQAANHAVRDDPAGDPPAAPAAEPTEDDEEDQTGEEAEQEDGADAERGTRRDGTRAVSISNVDDDAIADAVQAWRDTFAGTKYETLLDATVREAQDAN
jgi:hypothetical protein